MTSVEKMITDFKNGEWALVGYDDGSETPHIVYSPLWPTVPLATRMKLVTAWIDALGEAYDKLVDEPGEEDGA